MSDIKGVKVGTVSCCSAIWGGLWQLMGEEAGGGSRSANSTEGNRPKHACCYGKALPLQASTFGITLEGFCSK